MANQTHIPLPVSNEPVRRPLTRAAKWRMTSLITIHVLMLVHIAYWMIVGTTVSPVEPSEAMDTLRTGAVNAGFVFFAVSILATLIFGRFFCGWGCHMIAIQDSFGWVLKRIGIKPNPLRSRVLMLVPLGMAIYMFVWPVAYRWWVVWLDPALTSYNPAMTNAFMTEAFWETFPGWIFSVLTVLIAGFGIVYFLGNKGFCTYACPYGGVFAIVERASPLRVRVSDSCIQSGECSKACGSNVRVAEEVLAYGMVVDPGCMKCADCISSCPTSALSFGFGSTAVLPKIKAEIPSNDKVPALPLVEELILLAGFGFFLFAWWGLYGNFPFLLSTGMACMLAYVVLVLVRLFRGGDVSFQNLTLKENGVLRPMGRVFMVCAGLLVIISTHNAVVQYHRYWGDLHYGKTGSSDKDWNPKFDPQRYLSADVKRERDLAFDHYTKQKDWSLVDTAMVNQRLAWLNLLRGDDQAGEDAIRTAIRLAPEWPLAHYQLARFLSKRRAYDESIASFRKAIKLKSPFHEAEYRLGLTLIVAQRFEEALAYFENMIEHSHTDAQTHYSAGAIALNLGRPAQAKPHLEKAIELDPRLAPAREQLGLLLLTESNVNEAIEQLKIAVEIDPSLTLAQYNLGVAYFMRRDFVNAKVHAKIAADLNPTDKQAKNFLKMLDQQQTRQP